MALYGQAYNTKLETQKKYKIIAATALSVALALCEMFCRDWLSIQQPHLWINGVGFLYFVSGPPQGRCEQCDDRQSDHEGSELFQGSFSR